MAPRVIAAAVAALALSGLAGAAQAQNTPPPAYQWAAQAGDVPASVLFAVALQESGIHRNGRTVPWPWTLNIAGTPNRYSNRRDACAALRSALTQVSATRIDVGLGQINVGYHGHRVKKPCELLDPHQNLLIAAAILREQHQTGDDWLIAIGRYHRPAGGEAAVRYRRSVTRHLIRVLGADHRNILAQELK